MSRPAISIIRSWWTILLILGVVSMAAPARSVADNYVLHEFRKVRLTKEYYAEGAGAGDFNHDGHMDVVCGPYWFAGPQFTERHQFYAGEAFPNDRGYSDNFFSFVGDLSGDGWDDVLVVGLPGTPAHWYENTRGEGVWKKHLAFAVVDNEAPLFEDLTGDGRPELVCTFEGRLGFAAPDPKSPRRPWQWHPISDRGKWHRFSHGLGIGDVNGDGRSDFLTTTGWWEQPESLSAGSTWRHHAANFGEGGAQIYAYDVDGDGDNDIVTSIQAHGWGLSWFEQTAGDGGQTTFREHKIMGPRRVDNPYGVCFSQLHAVDVADLDGDGLKDIVAGKCYWAHNGKDPGARQPAVIYYFRLTREGGRARFVPHRVDDNSGVGRQVRAVDMNGDGLTDMIAGNKKGTFLFVHERRRVSKAAWERAQPKLLENLGDDKTSGQAATADQD